MPYSSNIFDIQIRNILKFFKPKLFFDLGSGAGKYGILIKKVSPLSRSIGIEIEKSYIEKFRLFQIYDELWNISAGDLIHPKYYDYYFDTIMIGDLIEHLKKSDGVDLLNFLIYRSKWIIIEFPYHYLQNSVENISSEAHISVWTEDDFSHFERTKMYYNETQRLIVLRGYLENEIPVETIQSVIEKK